jgi:hypothetical protein
MERSLHKELCRAAKILAFLQELTDGEQRSRAAQPVRIAELLGTKLASLQQPMWLGKMRAVVQAPDTLVCYGNPSVIDQALDFLFEVLCQAACPGGSLEITAHPGKVQVELRFTVPSDRGVQLAGQLKCDAHPFEANGFAFESGKLPQVALVLSNLKASGGDLRIQGSDTALALSLVLRLAPAGAATFATVTESVSYSTSELPSEVPSKLQ